MTKEEITEAIMNTIGEWPVTDQKIEELAERWEESITEAYQRGQANVEESYEGYVFMG